MRPLFFVIFVLVLALSCGPVFAADNNVIKIIREDGSVTKFELPEGAARSPVSTKTTKQKAEKPKTQEKQQAVQKKQPEQESAPLEKAVSPEQKTKTENAAVDAEPVAREAEKKALPEQKVTSTEDVVEQAKPRKAALPVPGRKPPIPNRLTLKEPKPGQQYITRDAALRIALDVAPPARRFNVVPVTYKDKPAYQVTFVTDDGTKEIMIDAQTGDIMR